MIYLSYYTNRLFKLSLLCSLWWLKIRTIQFPFMLYDFLGSIYWFHLYIIFTTYITLIDTSVFTQRERRKLISAIGSVALWSLDPLFRQGSIFLFLIYSLHPFFLHSSCLLIHTTLSFYFNFSPTLVWLMTSYPWNIEYVVRR